MNDKKFSALVAAVATLAIAALFLDGCCIDEVDVDAESADNFRAEATTNEVSPELPREFAPSCNPPMVSSGVVEECSNGWATIAYELPFEELARSHVVLFYCKEPAHPIVGHVRLQAMGWVKDGQVAVDCGNADFAIVFP